MARPSISRITLTGPATKGSPKGLAFTDFRATAKGASANVLGRYFRANEYLSPAAEVVTHVNGVEVGSPAILPTALTEYKFPNYDLVLRQTGWATMLFWNRAELLPHIPEVDDDNEDVDPDEGIGVGDYWSYRATLSNGRQEQRIRLGRAPSPGDVIRAAYYIIDWDA